MITLFMATYNNERFLFVFCFSYLLLMLYPSHRCIHSSIHPNICMYTSSNRFFLSSFRLHLAHECYPMMLFKDCLSPLISAFHPPHPKLTLYKLMIHGRYTELACCISWIENKSVLSPILHNFVASFSQSRHEHQKAQGTSLKVSFGVPPLCLRLFVFA